MCVLRRRLPLVARERVLHCLGCAPFQPLVPLPSPPLPAPAEHMFFATAERIAAVRRMIAAEELLEGEGSRWGSATRRLPCATRQGLGLAFPAGRHLSSPPSPCLVTTPLMPPSLPRPPPAPLLRCSAADALAALKEFQREDFEGIFTAMDGLPGERPSSMLSTTRSPC